MKVQLDERGWVKHVGKTLPADQIDAQLIRARFFPGARDPNYSVMPSKRHFGIKPSLNHGI